jgi:hypothetical protein
MEFFVFHKPLIGFYLYLYEVYFSDVIHFDFWTYWPITKPTLYYAIKNFPCTNRYNWWPHEICLQSMSVGHSVSHFIHSHAWSFGNVFVFVHRIKMIWLVHVTLVFMNQHSITSQKMWIFNSTAGRTSYFAWFDTVLLDTEFFHIWSLYIQRPVTLELFLKLL